MSNPMLMKIYRFVLGFLTPYVVLFALFVGYDRFQHGNIIQALLALCLVPIGVGLWTAARPSYATIAATLFWSMAVNLGMPYLPGIYGSITVAVFLFSFAFGVFTAATGAIHKRKARGEMVRRVRERYQNQSLSVEP